MRTRAWALGISLGAVGCLTVEQLPVPECTESELGCQDSATPTQCTEGKWTALDACGEGSKCQPGDGCVPNECNDGDTWCASGSTPWQCIELKWKALLPCTEGLTCQPPANTCLPATSCTTIFTCRESCLDSDCLAACLWAGSESAQTDFKAFDLCSQTNCLEVGGPEAYYCLAQYCSSQASLCLYAAAASTPFTSCESVVTCVQSEVTGGVPKTIGEAAGICASQAQPTPKQLFTALYFCRLYECAALAPKEGAPESLEYQKCFAEGVDGTCDSYEALCF